MHKEITIMDMDIIYKVDYRNVKYPRLEFKTGDLLLILPKDYKKDEKDLIHKHQGWIYKKQKEIVKALQRTSKKTLNKKRDKEVFKEYVLEIAEGFMEDLGVEARQINFRIMKSKWASCSDRRNLTINTLLMYLPNDLIKYVVYHEVVHLKEKEHSKKFWDIIKKKFKYYNRKEKDLLTYWFLIQEERKSGEIA